MGELADRINKEAGRMSPIDGFNLRGIARDVAGLEDVEPSRFNLIRERSELRTRVAELELLAEQLQSLNALSNGETPVILDDDITSVGTLRTRLVAAERRAEQAEDEERRAWLTAIAVVERGAFPRHQKQLAMDAGYMQHVTLFAANGERDLDIQFTTQERAFRGVFVVFSEEDLPPPLADNLERRGTELIEAGEKLLAEYQRQKAAEKVPA